MCGIFGFGGVSIDNERTVVDGRINKFLTALSHRGPNDCGYFITSDFDENKTSYFVIGHTRLSILDLTISGHQPMSSLDNRFKIVFNGEIYNYREIKADLISLGFQFNSNSDTEVLLNAWIAWGGGCLPKLTGMFAFAVYDSLDNKITLVRDAFGIKPLYYLFENGEFTFSSEIPSLVTVMNVRPSLNMQRCYDYLVHGDYDIEDQTFLNEVKQLKPGCYLEFDLNSCQIRKVEKWWSPSYELNADIEFDQAVILVREKFLENIRLHLRSDVPVGAALSGGVDSSAIVCAMRHVDPNLIINTFSYIAEGDDINEEYWIDLVNKHVGAVPHKIHVNSDDLLSHLDNLIKIQGEPFGSTSIYAQYRVFKHAAEVGIKVALDGQGADEMLAGYIGYPGHRLLSLLENGKVIGAWDFLKKWADWPGRSKFLAFKYFVSLIAGKYTYEFLLKISSKKSAPNWINKNILISNGVILSKNRISSASVSKGRRVIDILAFSLFSRGLNFLLRHGDRNSMAFGVESRVPFLTNEFVSFLLSLPESYLISNDGQTKYVFREAMRGIVPDEILDRKDKIGFETDERALIIKIAPICRVWLANIDLDFINHVELLKEFDEIVAGKKKYDRKIWRWINFARWKTLMHL